MSQYPTLTSLVLAGLRAGSGRPLVVHPDRTLSGADLAAESERVAAGLHAAGVMPGDRVALLMDNAWQFPVCDVAILRLGAVKVPLNEMLPAGDIGYMLEHSEAAVLIVGPTLVERAAKALAGLAHTPLVVLLTPDEGAAEVLGSGCVPFEDLDGDRAVIDRIQVRQEDPAALFYTGGTTGRPKGVLHTQVSLGANQIAQLLEAEIRSTDQLLLSTPLPHAAGLFLQAAIIRGATAHILPRFDPHDVIAYMREHGITWTFLVPTMIYRLLDVAANEDVELPALQTIVYGAAPIGQDRLREGLERWGPVFIQLYAQTECPNWGTRLAKQDHRLDASGIRLLSSCGRPSMLADVAIADDTGNFLPAGSVGEVCLRAPYLLQEYWKNADATAAKFLGAWIRTGDIGVMDDDGYLFLKDRRADMIISGGMNVYTSEVEQCIGQLDAVDLVAVVGIPHPDWGEAVHAVVVREAALEPSDVLEHCREHLARYAVPKSIEFVDELPVTAYGKIDKAAIRATYWAGHERQIN